MTAESTRRRSTATFATFPLLLLLLGTATSALAAQQRSAGAPQAGGAPGGSIKGRRILLPAEFARTAPRTALDMVRQVPGFILQQPDQRRGFGDAGGNVLINGQRISGKSNDALSELSRIPARNVVQIEISDAATLGIAGLSGQVANVVARSGGLNGQFAWRPEFAARDTAPLLTRGDASVSGTSGQIDYTLGLRNDASRRSAGGPTLIFRNAGGAIAEFRQEEGHAFTERPKISGSLTFDGPGSSIAKVNMSYGQLWFTGLEDSDRRVPGEVDRFRALRANQKNRTYEIGGDVDAAVGPGRLKIIGLRQAENGTVATQVLTSFADGRAREGNRFVRDSDTSETIGRAEYRWKSGPGEWLLSAEGAFNSLTSASALFSLAGDGIFREVPRPGGTATVAEDRGEGNVSYSRPLSRKLSVHASAGAEYSRLSVEGLGGSARSFYRPKGFVSLSWRPSPQVATSAKLERKVGQLNFLDFLATENLSSENRNAGNPNLVPPQSWEVDVSFARNIREYGSTNLRVYGRVLEDVVDIIPIGESGESPGNLDRAVILGVESKNTVLFDRIGWAGAKLDARLQFQTSRVQDPLDAQDRQISGALVRLVELSLRHDVPKTEWAWGASLAHSRSAKSFRLGEVSLAYEGPVFINAYLEHKSLFGLTVRGAVTNLLGGDQVLDRVVYERRRTGPLAFIEKRRRSIGPIFSMSVSGTF